MLVHVVPHDLLKDQMPRGFKRRITLEASSVQEILSALFRIEGVEALLHLYPVEWRIGDKWGKARKFSTAEDLVAASLGAHLNADGSLTVHLRPDPTAEDPATIITSLIISAITTAASMIISYMNPPNVAKEDTRKSVLYDNGGNTQTEGGPLPYLMGRQVYIEPPVIELSTSTLAGTGLNDGSVGGTSNAYTGGSVFDYLRYNVAQMADAAGGQKTPRKAEINGYSNAIQRVCFALGAGRIGGPKGDNLTQVMTNIWINEQQLLDPVTGQYSIPQNSFSFDWTHGEPGQPAMGLSPGIANSQGRNVTIKRLTTTGSLFEHEERVTDNSVDRAVVRIRAVLNSRDTKGNEGNTSVVIRCFAKRIADSVWLDRGIVPYLSNRFSTSAFDVEHNIAAPPKKDNGETWEFKFRRDTADSTDSNLVNDTVFVGFDEFQDRELTYDGSETPGGYPTALLACVFRLAELDQSRSPKVGVVCEGREVWVEKNYNPETRTWATTGPGTLPDGSWDGTRKRSSSENPAHHWYTMLVESRIGVGVDDSFFDRFALHEIAQFNDQLVNGRHRFSMNWAHTEFGKPWDVAADVARSMRAMQFWSGDRIGLVQDRPTGGKRHFVTNGMVKDGAFTIRKKPVDQRYNEVQVIYRNKKDMWREAVVVFRDEANIALRKRQGLGVGGVISTRVKKWGCYDEQEAYDFARMVCYDAIYEPNVTTYDINSAALLYNPGELIEVDDQNLSGKPLGERIKRVVDGNTLELDYPVPFKGGETYTLRGILNGIRIVKAVGLFNADTTTDTITVPNHGLVAGTPYSLVEASGAQPRDYRIVDIKDAEKPGFYTCTLQQHTEAKYAYIEQNVPVPIVPYTDRITTVSTPINMAAEERFSIDGLGKANRDIAVSWLDGDNPALRPAGQQFREQRDGYRVETRFNNGAWEYHSVTPTFGITVRDVRPGKYDFRVRAISISSVSDWANTTCIISAEGFTKPFPPTVEAYY